MAPAYNCTVYTGEQYISSHGHNFTVSEEHRMNGISEYVFQGLRAEWKLLTQCLILHSCVDGSV